MSNLMQTVTRIGRRLAAAGREAREATKTVAGPAADEVTQVIGAAVGEVVRAAVIGAVAAAIRGGTTHFRKAPVTPPYTPWDDEELALTEGEPAENVDRTDKGTENAPRPAWAKTTRAVGSALTVAAGAAAAVPGGRMVAAGLGALAAVSGLAARAGDPGPGE